MTFKRGDLVKIGNRRFIVVSEDTARSRVVVKDDEGEQMAVPTRRVKHA